MGVRHACSHTVFLENCDAFITRENSFALGLSSVSESTISEGMVSEGTVSEGMVSEGTVSEGNVSESTVYPLSSVSSVSLRSWRSDIIFSTPSSSPTSDSNHSFSVISRSRMGSFQVRSGIGHTPILPSVRHTDQTATEGFNDRLPGDSSFKRTSTVIQENVEVRIICIFSKNSHFFLYCNCKDSA